MWDLTVPGNRDHDFYVVADSVKSAVGSHGYSVPVVTPILVHNCPPEDAGKSAQSLGAAREQYVADLVGGTPATDENGVGMLVTRPGVGKTDVDVIGPNGEYIGVGGSAKAMNPSQFGSKLSILKWAAGEAGVPAQYYLEEGTPQSIVNQAYKVLGKNNVFSFSDADVLGG